MSRLFKTISETVRQFFAVQQSTVAVREAADAGDYEALAMLLLRQEETISIAMLIKRVAEEVYRADLRAGGGAVDIGVWGPSLYQPDATRAVCQLVGHALVLEDDGGPLAVQSAWA